MIFYKRNQGDSAMNALELILKGNPSLINLKLLFFIWL